MSIKAITTLNTLNTFFNIGIGNASILNINKSKDEKTAFKKKEPEIFELLNSDTKILASCFYEAIYDECIN